MRGSTRVVALSVSTTKTATLERALSVAAARAWGESVSANGRPSAAAAELNRKSLLSTYYASFALRAKSDHAGRPCPARGKKMREMRRKRTKVVLVPLNFTKLSKIRYFCVLERIGVRATRASRLIPSKALRGGGECPAD